MSKPAAAPIIRRRVNIAFDSAKARGWHLHRQEIEDFMNALSFVFPPGEKFFIHSVRHYEHRITDPVLKEQVRRFIYQEAMHSKEHSRCNLALNEAFPHGPRIEKILDVTFAVIRRINFKSTQLAITCALEHFTAILADGLLKNQQGFLTDSDPEFASLWLWHAVEEAEHKAVCFDVYDHLFGRNVFSYALRVFAMFATTVGFLITVLVAIRLLKKRGKTSTNDTSAAPARNSKGFRQILRETFSMSLYRNYYRYSFHPWDDDNTVYIEEWKQRYKGFGASPDTAPSEATA